MPPEMVQQSNFAQTTLGQDTLGEYIRNLLDRTPFARPTMLGSQHASIRALSELLDKGVLGIDDELLVQCLHRVSLGSHNGSDAS